MSDAVIAGATHLADVYEVTPVVYCSPYEYSSPEVEEENLPQDRRLGTEATRARVH